MDKTIIVAIVTGVFTGIIAPLIKYGIDKATRKEDRANKKEDTLSDWQKSVDARINKVIATVDNINGELSDYKEMSKRCLKGTMLTMQHITEGNHTELLREFTRETENYLIDKK